MKKLYVLFLVPALLMFAGASETDESGNVRNLITRSTYTFYQDSLDQDSLPDTNYHIISLLDVDPTEQLNLGFYANPTSGSKFTKVRLNIYLSDRKVTGLEASGKVNPYWDSVYQIDTGAFKNCSLAWKCTTFSIQNLPRSRYMLLKWIPVTPHARNCYIKWFLQFEKPEKG